MHLSLRKVAHIEYPSERQERDARMTAFQVIKGEEGAEVTPY